MSTETQTRRKIKLKKPAKYCNIFYNNDLTTFDAVIHIFTTIFNLTPEDALKKTQEINDTGESIVFISSKESCGLKYEITEREKKRLGNAHNIHLLEHKVEIFNNEEDV